MHLCASVAKIACLLPAFRNAVAHTTPMILRSDIETRSPEFAANAAAMRALVTDLRNKVATVAQGGGEVARHPIVPAASCFPVNVSRD